MPSGFYKLKPHRQYVRHKFLHNDIPEQVWMQFVPGKVIEVIANSSNSHYNGPRDINAIIARVHGENELQFDKVTTTKYFPLFRGQVDVPVKGDQVLLCTFGGINYYIGPVNTMNNPNYNIDHLAIPDQKIGSITLKNIYADGKYIIRPTNRLQKFDDNNVGDYVVEGRYGNSIRIGSSQGRPYIIMSNGRNPGSTVEGYNDTALFAFIDDGKTLQEFFNFGLKVDTTEDSKEQTTFILPSDSNENGNLKIGNNLYDYSYSESQVLLSSKRLTFNATDNDITLSSFGKINIGSRNDINIVANTGVNINSNNIYLGREASEKDEPIVLGEQLRLLLNEILDLILNVKMTGCVSGLSGPIDPTTLAKIQALQNQLSSKDTTKLLSRHHYVGKNR